MDPNERMFLEAAERGDKHTMMRCLAPPCPVNVNCTDILGRTAIQIVVDNENVEIVELLLKQENVKIGKKICFHFHYRFHCRDYCTVYLKLRTLLMENGRKN